jgi:hypothetical protein
MRKRKNSEKLMSKKQSWWLKLEKKLKLNFSSRPLINLIEKFKPKWDLMNKLVCGRRNGKSGNKRTRG